MDKATLARWRMHNLRLWERHGSPAEVIRGLAASQGQDFLPALWSLAQRCHEVPAYDEVAAAFDRGEILRTHLLRPTWHLVAPEDIRWLLTATAPRVHKLNAYYDRQLGVDEAVVRQLRSTLERLLHGRHVTRAELGAALGAEGNRLGYLLMWAELEGWICSGARSGNQQTYALLDERVPAGHLSREEALAELARRYFATRGPATVKDLAGWASLTVTEAKQARSAVDGFDDLEIDGRTYVVHGDPPPPGVGRVVDLVQAYDECIMSYSESKDVLTQAPLWTKAAPPSYMHAILVDGRLVGHWRYDRDSKGRPDSVQTFTHRPLTPEEKDALNMESDRFSAFADRQVALRD